MGGARVLERCEPRPPDGRARARAAARGRRSGLSRPAGTAAPILPPVLGAVLTAAVTPFDESGGVDEAAYRTLVRRLLDSGSDGIVVAGTTGEASTLSDVERIALFEATREETRGRATMVAGTGSNDTAHSVHLTQVAAELGADAVLVVTPYYNKPPAEGIRRHVAAIAEVGRFDFPNRWHQPRIPGFGEIDCGEFLAEVRRVGYDGPVCIEVEDESLVFSPTQVATLTTLVPLQPRHRHPLRVPN